MCAEGIADAVSGHVEYEGYGEYRVPKRVRNLIDGMAGAKKQYSHSEQACLSLSKTRAERCGADDS